MILAHTHVITGMVLRTSLTYQYVTGLDNIVYFRSRDRSSSFRPLFCVPYLYRSSLSYYLLYFYFRKLLTVTVQFAVIVSALFVEYQHLFSLY